MGMPSMDSANQWSRALARIFAVETALAEMRSSIGQFENVTIGAGGMDFKGGGQLTFFDASDRAIMALARGIFDQIEPDTGGRVLITNGQLRFWDDYINSPDSPGRIMVDQGTGANYLRMFPPYASGTGRENSITVQGRRAGQNGAAWIYCDGVTQINGDERVAVYGKRIEIVAGTDGTGVFGTPTTSAAANLVLATVSGQFQLARSTSSRRYKQDIEAAEVDSVEVLSLIGRTWHDKNEVAAPDGTDRRFVGFIAEELDERPSLRQFVDYDEQGRPDAIQYDRLSVALLEVAKDQQTRLDDQQARLDAQAERLDAMEARLAALEGAS